MFLRKMHAFKGRRPRAVLPASYLFVVFRMSTYFIYMGHRPCAAPPGSYRYILFLATVLSCHHFGIQKT